MAGIVRDIAGSEYATLWFARLFPHQVIEIIRMRCFTVRSERIPELSLFASASVSLLILRLFVPTLQSVCLSAGIKSVSTARSLPLNVRENSTESSLFVCFVSSLIICSLPLRPAVLFLGYSYNRIAASFASAGEMMKLVGQFGSIRARFSIRHLFLFSASALLVIVTYRPYSNNSSPVLSSAAVENADVIDSDHPTSKECRPANKIAFMKTHKCASSTIENILFRHALRENLNVAMPLKGNYLSRTELFNRSSVLNTPWGGLPVDIFTLHNRWNRDQVMALMGPSTFAFSVVRDPVDQFESLYNYMSLSSTYKTDLKGFVRILRDNQSAFDHKPRGGLGRFGRNQIAFDWGVSPKLFDQDPEIIRQRIEQLDDQFELVLIAERMEESLVLLADRLCWPLEYVTHLDLNVRKPERTVTLEEDERHILGSWLNFDTNIYEYFCRRFDDHVARFNSVAGQPDRMEEQVRLLRQSNLQLQERCVIQRVGNEKLRGKFLETHNDTFGYLIQPNKPDCDPYAMSEPAYLRFFREKLTQRAKMALKRNPFHVASSSTRSN